MAYKFIDPFPVKSNGGTVENIGTERIVAISDDHTILGRVRYYIGPEQHSLRDLGVFDVDAILFKNGARFFVDGIEDIGMRYHGAGVVKIPDTFHVQVRYDASGYLEVHYASNFYTSLISFLFDHPRAMTPGSSEYRFFSSADCVPISL